MSTDLQEQIRELIEGGAAPISLTEIRDREITRRTAPQPRSHRVGAIAAALVAFGGAGALVASQLTGSPPAGEPGRPTDTVLTAAMVHHVAAASRAALANSGRAQIAYRTAQAGVAQDYGTDNISFSGQDWNFAGRVTTPAAAGQPAATESFVNRVVDGQAYDYFVAGDGLRWYHEIGPDAIANLDIPDPRTMLRTLQPGARFERVGSQLLDGVRVEQLRATDLRHLASLSALPEVQPGERVTALDVWVDGSGVVRQMSLVLRGTVQVWTFSSNQRARAALQKIKQRETKRISPAEFRQDMRKLGMATEHSEVTQTDLTVSFLDIGHPQAITAPPHPIAVYGRG
jgi:hypothetical protein